MNLIPVESSNILAIGFEAPDKLLIKFSSEKIYVYECVTLEKFEEFLTSDSKGKYFHQHIVKNHKSYLLEDKENVSG